MTETRDRRELEEALRCGCEGMFDRTTLVVLGSGMSSCFAPDEVEILTDWKGGGVDGHPGAIARLRTGGLPVILSMGRRHLYEGFSVEETSEVVDTAGRLGVRRLLLTSAAGGLSPLLHIGDVVLHSGYLTMMLGGYVRHSSRIVGVGGTENPSPLNGRVGGPLVRDEVRVALHERMLGAGIAPRLGTYAGVLGPSYETRAEIRMLRRLGADVVGMSVIPELQAAAAYGMKAIGLSLVTNVATEFPPALLSHEEVTGASAASASVLRRTIDEAIHILSRAEDVARH